MSVDNFIQQEFFVDILHPVPPTSSPMQTPFTVVRSPRRRRTITAVRKNGLIEIHIPARTSKREEAKVVPEMIALVLARESKLRRTDEALVAIAQELLARYLPEFDESPTSITWRKMRDRWGSCTTIDRTIRISDRLNGAPEFVLDWVIFHELIHLRVPDHGKAFYALLSRFPENQRAEAYLDGYEAGLADTPAEKWQQATGQPFGSH